ncbi:hypothetical protein [Ruminococcus flavefaciens]|uniref:hypothetical protein n=1 Tax=Ruminococcus flavefaciens TaxID=1265 RepID=UPI0026EF9B6A|nr:hypothetical protein [Ruminococcus flavefaciens]
MKNIEITTNMTMTYELITPEIASNMLETNTQNRTLSKGTITAYVNDMLSGNWDETVGDAISIDENGILRNGQHRLNAIVESGVSVRMWVCRNVSSDGIYDNNRKRSNADQIMIMRSDFDNVYKTSRYISVARTLINYSKDPSQMRRMVTPKEIIDFTEQHKEDLDSFFLNMPQTTVPKISLAVVHLALFMAYMSGVEMDDILAFYDTLCSGMSTKQEEFPIIAYRNYLKDTSSVSSTLLEIGRCQYALKKYLTGSCVKRSISPKELIYPFPYC